MSSIVTVLALSQFDYYATAPIGWRHKALMAVVCLSVCLSVPCLTLSRERKGVASWKLARRKPMTWVIHDPTETSKGQRSRSPGRSTLWPKISRIFWMERPIRTSNLEYGWNTITDMRGVLRGHRTHAHNGTWRPASLTCAMTSKLKVAVQVITCRGRGHILAAALRAAQLVCNCGSTPERPYVGLNIKMRIHSKKQRRLPCYHSEEHRHSYAQGRRKERPDWWWDAAAMSRWCCRGLPNFTQLRASSSLNLALTQFSVNEQVQLAVNVQSDNGPRICFMRPMRRKQSLATLPGSGYNLESTSVQLMFDFRSTAIQVPLNRATIIRRPTLRPGCCTAA